MHAVVVATNNVLILDTHYHNTFRLSLSFFFFFVFFFFLEKRFLGHGICSEALIIESGPTPSSTLCELAGF